MDVLQRTKLWFEKARPNPDETHFSAQVGVHFEEVAEMVAEIKPLDDETNEALINAKIALTHLSDHLKANPGCIDITNRELFIDAICDQIVTATGSAHCAEMDVIGAMEEVNRSNFSKFDDEGNPIFNDQMKVIKGPNYIKADLTSFA